MVNELDKRQISDSSVIEDDELYSKGLAGPPFYASMPILSTTSGTKIVVFSSPVDLAEPRVAVLDIFKILTGPAAGVYTVDQILSTTSLKVLESIATSGSGNNGEVYYRSGAKLTGYDNSTNTIPHTNVQDALTFVYTSSASPGFVFSRQGNGPPGAWLLWDGKPSNETGIPVFLASAVIKKIFTANKAAQVIKLDLYWHEGDGINLTFLTSVTTAAQRTNSFNVNLSVPSGKQLAMRVAPDSPNSTTVVGAGLIMTGNLV